MKAIARNSPIILYSFFRLSRDRFSCRTRVEDQKKARLKICSVMKREEDFLSMMASIPSRDTYSVPQNSCIYDNKSPEQNIKRLIATLFTENFNFLYTGNGLCSVVVPNGDSQRMYAVVRWNTEDYFGEHLLGLQEY